VSRVSPTLHHDGVTTQLRPTQERISYQRSSGNPYCPYFTTLLKNDCIIRHLFVWLILVGMFGNLVSFCGGYFDLVHFGSSFLTACSFFKLSEARPTGKRSLNKYLSETRFSNQAKLE
jgi:hypothetical protein